MAKELTAHQQKLWDLHTAGKARAEIAEAMQISPNNVSKTLTIIRKKLGVKDNPKARGAALRVENSNPALAAAAIDYITEPLEASIKQFATETGVNYSTAKALVKRIQARNGQFISQVRDLKTQELSSMIGSKIHLMLGYLDDAVVAQASARDLSMAIAQLTEKRQLLRGEPTAIISDHDRKKLHELAAPLVAALQRRGITLDGQITERTVEPVRTEP